MEDSLHGVHKPVQIDGAVRLEHVREVCPASMLIADPTKMAAITRCIVP